MISFEECRVVINDLVKGHGGIPIVASLLKVHMNTVWKVINGKEISEYSQMKLCRLIENKGITNLSKVETNAPGTEEFRQALQKVVRELGSEEAVASKYGFHISTIKRALDGSTLTPVTIQKIRETITGKREKGKGRNEKRLIDVFEMYKQEGTLEKAGKKLNLSRERVRQLIRKGERIGLFDYNSQVSPDIPKEELLTSFEVLGSLGKVAKKHSISLAYLKKLFRKNGVKRSQLKELLLKHRKAKALFEFEEFAGQFGSYPNSTELQKTSEGHSLYSRITRYWGSIDGIREELNIPKPPLGNPRFKELMKPNIDYKRRIALIVRTQHLDMIKESLGGGTQSMREIARYCGFRLPRTSRLVNILINRGEVTKKGVGRDVIYELSH